MKLEYLERAVAASRAGKPAAIATNMTSGLQSLIEGIEVTGMPQTVLSRGNVVMDKDKFLGHAGAGEFVKRATYSQP